MGEFASKGVAGSGLGLGIAGTALGVLNASANGNGLLGGLFGGGMNQYAYGAAQAVLSEKDARIAKLEAEKYSDHVGIDVYTQSRKDNTDLRDRIMGEWLKPLAQESAATRERLAVLETEMKNNLEKAMLRETIINNKIDGVAMTASMGIKALKDVVDGFICRKVRKDAICPEVMERYNTWEAPTAAAPNTQPISGSVHVI